MLFSTSQLPRRKATKFVFGEFVFNAAIFVALCSAFDPAVTAQDEPEKPLRQIIDSFFRADLPRAGTASDAEFARRVSIDLTAMPPSSDRLREFLEDASKDKREKLVNELIESPHFERQLATFLDVMLMERRAFKDIKEPEWTAYLLDSVRSRKPWNVLAQEILAADGLSESTRPAVRFALARDAEPNSLTRDIGRVFFGRDLQCAQCHNHPLVDDYLQSDYQGLLAFVAPGYVKTIQKPGPKTKDGKPGKPISLKIYAEKDGNDIDFESVFVKDTKHRTGPRLIGEKSVVETDRLPVSSTTNRPKYSRRNMMAEQATDGSNQAFNENMANRLWGMMMGRGLVHPPDFHHRDNPAIKPQLLKALGHEFVKMDFDMRDFLKEIALSQVYQRAYELPVFDSSIAEIEKQLSVKRGRLSSLKQEISTAVEQYDKATTAWSAAESEHIPVAIEVEKLRAQFAKLSVDSVKLKSAWETARVEAQKQADLQGVLKSLSGSFQTVGATLNDADIATLNKKIEAKLKKSLSTAKASKTKSADAEQKWKANQSQIESSKTSLNQGFAKRKPFRERFDRAENDARRLRSKLESLMSARSAIESEIATDEKIIAHYRLSQRIRQLSVDGQAGPERQQLNSERARLNDSLIVRLSNKNLVSSLRPLSPEQLCWTTLKVTGFYDRYYAGEEAKLRKELKIEKEKTLNLDHLRTLEARTHKVLKGHLNNFIRYYSAGAGQPQGDFFATADQALFASNSGSINSYLNPSSGNVTDRVVKSKDTSWAAQELYLAILTRQPTQDEIADVEHYLNSKSENKRQAVLEIAWSLINSAEFRFNH